MPNYDNTEYTVTAADVCALRAADDAVFRHNADGTGSIHILWDDQGTACTRTIPVAYSRVRALTGSADAYVPCYVALNVKFSPGCIRSALRGVRAGSTVTLEWTRGNSSPVLESAGMVRDELRMVVQRKGVRHPEHYLIAVEVGLDNTARMVRTAVPE